MPSSALAASRGRGAFIVVEGLDRSGKSTQCARLVSRIRSSGRAVVDATWRFPDRTSATGGLISEVLSGSREAPDARALHLLFTANRWERMGALRELLAAGVCVVADRYAYSGAAHSAGAQGAEGGWARRVEGGPVATGVGVFLRVEEGVGQGRGGLFYLGRVC